MSYNAKVYMKQGGDALVISEGGAIESETDGQAAAIADIDTTTGNFTEAERIKFNEVLAALRAVRIIAS